MKWVEAGKGEAVNLALMTKICVERKEGYQPRLNNPHQLVAKNATERHVLAEGTKDEMMRRYQRLTQDLWESEHDIRRPTYD